MLHVLAALPFPLLIAFFVVAFVLATYLLMQLIDRALPFELRHRNNDVIGATIAVVAVFYGLIIASILVIAIDRFDHAQQVAENEASLVADIVRNARAISPQMETPVRQAASRYLEDIVTKEWPGQMRGQKTMLALPALSALSLEISRYEPRNQREAAYYLQVVQTLTKLYDARKERIFIVGQGITGAVWSVTLAGAIVTICLALLFGIENRTMHFMLAAFLAASLALIFALVASFDTPFQGKVSVSDEPYRLVREQIMRH